MNRATIFMGASWAGLAGVAIYFAGRAFADLEWLKTPGILLIIGASLAMLWNRKADEYTEGLWNAGASVAFATMVLTAFAFSAGAGFFAGLLDLNSDNPVTADTVLSLEIAAFFVGVFAKRLLGDR